MNKKSLADISKEKYKKGKRLVAPLMGFPGVELVGSSIKLAQQNYSEHYKAIKKIVELFAPDIVFPLMDLSIEANALGRYTIFPMNESATVPKDKFKITELDKLKKINIYCDSRLIAYTETVKMMSMGLPDEIMKGAYVTGTYTLAALIIGADDAAMATITDPEGLQKLCDFTTEKIQEYVRLLIASGAEIICVLEPSAVMLGPDQFERFSASYIKHISQSFRYSGVNTIYHTCGNTMHLIEKMVNSDVNGISLDSKETGVDLKKVIEKVPESVVVIGNINPATTMARGTPDEIRKDVSTLMDEMQQYPNFILSTGCDLPQETPKENIIAFMEAGRKHTIKL